MRFKRGAHLPAKFRQIHFFDGLPTTVGCGGERADFGRGDAFPFEHIKIRPALAERQLHGMLMGFADLVFEQGGKYWVLDYKSNRLADYGPTSLAAAILEHRYDLQYTLYLVALHRLLRHRLPDYDYDRHLGGAIYLFARGVDEVGHGVFQDRPPRELIETLDAAFAEHLS